MTTEAQVDINITLRDIQAEGRKMLNCNAAGPDHVQVFYL